jgi:hypothetical protein
MAKKTGVGRLKIMIHIERILVEGGAGVPPSIAELEGSIRSGIQRLLAAQGIGPGMRASRDIHAIRHPHVSPPDAGGPEPLGRQIAEAILGGINP